MKKRQSGSLSTVAQSNCCCWRDRGYNVYLFLSLLNDSPSSFPSSFCSPIKIPLQEGKAFFLSTVDDNGLTCTDTDFPTFCSPDFFCWAGYLGWKRCDLPIRAILRTVLLEMYVGIRAFAAISGTIFRYPPESPTYSAANQAPHSCLEIHQSCNEIGRPNQITRTFLGLTYFSLPHFHFRHFEFTTDT